MNISIELLETVLQKSLDDFFAKETDAVLSRVSERNNCGRLAMYLEHAAKEAGLTEYYADPEYNRKQGGQVKTILNDEMKIVTIQCDLILHSRGKQIAADNLIAIEMKKVERPENEKNDDRDRLKAMTKSSYDNIWSFDGKTHPKHVCGYKLGLYIELDPGRRTALLEYYRGGSHVYSISRIF